MPSRLATGPIHSIVEFAHASGVDRLVLERAVRGGYAVGYFESWNIESLQGVIDAAEQTRSPIIVGFNGGFLSGHDRLAGERLSWYAALGRAAALSASVPCGLLFNEYPSDDWVALAIKSGFNLVMPADASAPFDRYVERVSALARLAHAHGVAVEAEVGELPRPKSASFPPASRGTAAGAEADPSLAARFVSATGIDLLAVSVGNVHVKVDGTQDLDLGRLAEIHRQVKLPLVLHGGTGISACSLRQAISLGVAKVSYGTYLKQSYLRAVRGALDREGLDPHRVLGMGGRTISWLPAALGSATRSSSGSTFSVVAGGRIDCERRPWTSR
ncbi:MAG: class II fructose-bisphosphate aldolase [Isosphaeraceae bacterium]